MDLLISIAGYAAQIIAGVIIGILALVLAAWTTGGGR